MKENFSTRLRDLREEKNLSQRKLAQLVHTNQTNISRWEKGEQDPSTDWVIKLAVFFGVTTDYILGVADHE